MAEFATGLIPAFLRGPARPARVRRRGGGWQEASFAFQGVADDGRDGAADLAAEAEPAPEPRPAEIAAQPADHNSYGDFSGPAQDPVGSPHHDYLRGASGERLATRQKLAGLLGLPPFCHVAACRRAGRCLGVRGATCLIDHDEVVKPALQALKARYPNGVPEEEE